MFTGLVEELAEIKQIEYLSDNAIQLTIAAKKIMTDIQIGDSIAVNGICLTVTNFTNNTFAVDIMPETLKVTSLRDLTLGSHVNVERSLRADSRMGGHFVTGHVDCTGTITRVESVENAVYFDVKFPKEFSHYVIDKGSIAIDGISLTVFAITEDTVTLSIIPHTLAVTVLGEKSVGDIVNIEFDMFAKMIEKQLNAIKVKN
ncbi:MAG TPA: riboflavin synthase [Pseudogracilibacillus sp.]|nr:riboflavin synthase [Pseudogracilibacillus sp.]